MLPLLLSIACCCVVSKTDSLVAYGDSKSELREGAGLNQGLFAQILLSQARLFPDCPNVRFDLVTPTGTGYLARGNHTLHQMAGYIAADLAEITGTPTAVLFSMGTVELPSLPAEATWKADALAVLDAMRARWPAVRVYMVKPWRRGYSAESDTLAGWIDAVITLRPSFVFAGHDERVWLEHGDDGVAYTSDGIHYSNKGSAECARQWRTILGF